VTEHSGAPAGWYDDGSGRQRWWDGSEWQQFAEAPTEPTASAGAKVLGGLALASMIVGIGAFLFGLAPVFGALLGATAIVLAIFAIRKSQSRGLAFTGIALGSVAILASMGTTALALGGAANLPSVSAPVPLTQEIDAEAVDELEELEDSTEPETPAPDPGPELSLGQLNAVASAESYLLYTGFSRSGLIAQLEFEGYTTEEATFAVDFVGADWNEQAVRSGETYLEFTAFSRSGLIDQLEYEGFSTAEATYAVEEIDPDWNAQAAASAESYLEFASFSRQGLIDQLRYEGFTQSEAEFGATAVGY